jgi:hypothetical protein
MSSIAVYDLDRIRLRTLAAQLDVSPAELVRRLLASATTETTVPEPEGRSMYGQPARDRERTDNDVSDGVVRK